MYSGATTVSVKIYYGSQHSTEREIRRFMFRPEPSVVAATVASRYTNATRYYSGSSTQLYTAAAQLTHNSSDAQPMSSSKASTGVFDDLVERIQQLYHGIDLSRMHLCWKGMFRC